MKLIDLFEGKYVVKSKDGVEKRFSNADSEEALAWKEKTVKKPKKVVHPKYSDGWWRDKEERTFSDIMVPWEKIGEYTDQDAIQAIVKDEFGENAEDSTIVKRGTMSRNGTTCATMTIRVIVKFTKDDDFGSDEDLIDAQSILIARNPKKPETIEFVKYV